MTEEVSQVPCIKIIANGPYIVEGDIKLSKKVITPRGRGYEYVDAGEIAHTTPFALCRCGHTKTPPFCDGAHVGSDFDGREMASRVPYETRAGIMEGPGIDLLDDERCAFARFCHREKGNIWELVDASADEAIKQEVIEAACDCPTGRLTAVDKDTATLIERDEEPAIEVLEDPQRDVSGPLAVKGGIPLVSADGTTYEIRNRMALCRCGYSRNQPFCDATHMIVHYRAERD
jgi:CDGSH-type Zn-finger protein